MDKQRAATIENYVKNSPFNWLINEEDGFALTRLSSVGVVRYQHSLGYLLFNTIVRLARSRREGRGDNESVPSLPRQRSAKGEGTKLNNAARGTVKEPVIELHSDNRLSRDASLPLFENTFRS